MTEAWHHNKDHMVIVTYKDQILNQPETVNVSTLNIPLSATVEDTEPTVRVNRVDVIDIKCKIVGSLDSTVRPNLV